MKYLIYFFSIAFIQPVLNHEGLDHEGMDHDVTIAIFHIKEEGANTMLHITLDLEDYMTSFDVSKDLINEKSMQENLQASTSFKFNGQPSFIKVSNISFARDHIKVEAKIEMSVKEIEKVEVYSSFLNNVRGHSNVMQIDLNNQSKDYRMHKHRTKIEVNYKT